MKSKRNDPVKGYKLDFTTGTVTLNYKFQRAMSDVGSPEYARLKEILEDFPHLSVVVKAGRTITTARPTKRLTYENMATFIDCHENRDELRAVFAVVRQRSKVLASPYKYVRDWFEAQFPNYRSYTSSDQTQEQVVMVAIPDVVQYKMKENAATTATMPT